MFCVAIGPGSASKSRKISPRVKTNNSGTAGSPGLSVPNLARRIGLFDATMLVIGGIVGSGIFRNPHVVAKEVHAPWLILGAWIFGGLIAMAGAFVYAELTASRPAVGGQYAYFKEAYHPALAFVYGWALLLVIQTGGMAAVSITFADYSVQMARTLGAGGMIEGLDHLGRFLPGTDPSQAGNAAGKLIAIVALAGLTVINCLGVRAGTAVQTTLTVLKMLAIAGLVGCGLFLLKPASGADVTVAADASGFSAVRQFGAAMVPVLFAYGGWQTAAFIGGEVKNPRRNLPLGLILGVLGVIALYLSVNWVCLRALGTAGLAATPTPAADVAKLALGERGSFLISAGIIISTLGFLSQGMLTAPRVYFAMADDGLFFRILARIHPETQVPVAAVALQGITAVAIALSGRYEQILNYVVSVDFIFYGLTATCVFVFRRRDRERVASGVKPSPAGSELGAVAGEAGPGGFRVPWHPLTTLFFIGSCWLVVLNLVFKYPKDSFVGVVIMLAGIPVYLYWQRRRRLAS